MPAGLICSLVFAGMHNRAMPRILLIDDDEHLAAPLASYFARFDCALDSATRPSVGLAKLRAGHYDAAILDVMLPEMDGFALCREIRKESDIPIVMLTARGDVMDRVVGLELGADDYIAKPFSPRELVARVRTILRRSGRGNGGATAPAPAPAAPAASASATPFALDAERMQIRYYGRLLELSRYEYGLLRLLIQRPGRVFTRDELLQLVWDDASDSFDRTVDAHVKTLRAKLRAIAPEVEAIRTLRGTGYALNEELPANRR